MRLVRPIATTLGPIRPLASAPRLEWPVAAAATLARLPVAASLRRPVGSVSIGSIGSAVGTASVEAHRRER
jgi:hypothetical protein